MENNLNYYIIQFFISIKTLFIDKLFVILSQKQQSNNTQKTKKF